ncbi:hypothetical protein NC652_021412 [Populus alba x Populus x berolinensis]|nr:hypothetical protein NC652_021412 [Populus alba x Populus x berolinensis]
MTTTLTSFVSLFLPFLYHEKNNIITDRCKNYIVKALRSIGLLKKNKLKVIKSFLSKKENQE